MNRPALSDAARAGTNGGTLTDAATDAGRSDGASSRSAVRAGRGPDKAGRRLFRRGPWENASASVIGLGIFMLVQPFALELYTWSFLVILAGTLGFLVTSHFRE